jgi:signal transduction histidine kinase
MSGDELADDERREIAERVHGTATALGESLRDIVWALRAGSESLEALVAYLGERGAALLAGRARFDLRASGVRPDTRIALPVRRQVQLLALEALHNCARHSGAAQVVLGLEALDDGLWHLWIEDDGGGLGGAGSGGLGLESMRRRAAMVHGELRLGARPGGGTRVELWFALGGTPARAPLVPPPPAPVHAPRSVATRS